MHGRLCKANETGNSVTVRSISLAPYTPGLDWVELTVMAALPPRAALQRCAAAGDWCVRGRRGGDGCGVGRGGTGGRAQYVWRSTLRV